MKKLDEVLEEKYNNNLNEIKKFGSPMIELLKENRLENKLKNILCFASVPSLLTLLLAGILRTSGLIVTSNSLLGIIFDFQAVYSIGIGFIVNKIITRKKNLQSVKDFSMALTESEKLEEEIEYTIELEKAKNRNNAILQLDNNIYSNEETLNEISQSYDVRYKKLNKTKEEFQSKVKEMYESLDYNFNNLDILTTKKVLHEKFGNVRNKKIYNILCNGLFGGTLLYLLISLPSLLLNSTNIITMLIKMLISIGCVSGYMIKRSNEYEMAFKNINFKLGEDDLKLNSSEEEINKSIQFKIESIGIIGLAINEEEKKLINLDNKEEIESNIVKEEQISKDNLINSIMNKFLSEEEGPILTLKKN